MSLKQRELVSKLVLPYKEEKGAKGKRNAAALRTILDALAHFADDDGGNVFPSVELVHWRTDYSVAQVRRIFRQLRADGILVKESDGRGGRGHPTIYRLDFSRCEKKMPWPQYRQLLKEKERLRRREKIDQRRKKTLAR